MSDLPPYEKLGAFYLGRAYDPETGETAEAPLLYDSKDLVTHAVIVGMTGSGKTGLGVGILEEAAMDGIPALVIDPKGDLGNLLLTFPELAPEDFEPWVGAEEAAKEGISRGELAAKKAELWRGGLGKWNQGPDRIQRLKDKVEMTLYTPGSDAGVPVSILASFAAPPKEVLDDGDLLRDKIAGTATSLLGLLGIDADPIQSREHILLSNLLETSWTEGKDLDLEGLIRGIQDPPFDKVGVFDLDSFFPAKDRFALAMQVNNLLASPGFSAWLEGEPLDVDRLLYTPEGKPRLAIFSIAHLGDQERMFFVSLLLAQTLAWMRGKPGTTSLRALLYMDEIFGFLPPVAEPPSKKPLLTLLKQARAYGVGLVLATQNPVDLDYKALSNAGTWMIGRLQTERDQRRLKEGLAASASAGEGQIEDLDELLAGIDKRVFLMRNVHEEAPVLFHTRWVMSYLAGPLTRAQIKRLTEGSKPAVAEAAAVAETPREAEAAEDGAGGSRPMLPPEVEEVFLPLRGRRENAVYRPALVSLVDMAYTDRRRGLSHQEEISVLLPLLPGDAVLDWEDAAVGQLGENDLERDPVEEVAFAELATDAANARSYRGWERDLEDHLYRNRAVTLWKSPTFKAISDPEESERDFRIRLGDQAREQRDAEKDKLRKKYETKFRRVEERIRVAQQRIEREEAQARSHKMDTLVSVGETVVGMLFGRRRRSLSTAGRRIGSAWRQHQDVGQAEDTLEARQQELKDLEAELQRELDALDDAFDPQTVELEPFDLRPRKTDVAVRLLALAWAPYRDGQPAW